MDLQTAPSICVHCGLGCNIIPGERYGTLRRILNRYNGAVNGYFLCDRGRFGYEFVNDPGRLREPLLKKDAALEPVSREEILHHAGGLLASGNRVIGIGSPRASLEANFALRTLVGPDNFYAGVSETEHRLVAAAADILRKGPCRSLSLREVETADSVLILGEDATNTAPMLALALRQAVLQKPREATAKEIAYWNAYGMKEIFQDERGPFFIAAPDVTRLDEVATQTYHAAPDDIARLGFLIAQEIDAEAEAAVGAAAPAPPSPERMARALGCFLADQLEREETGKGGSGLHEKTLPETVASALKEGGCPAPGPAGHAPLARRIADALGGLIAEATAHPETDKTEASLLARLVKALKNTKTPTPEEASELSQWLSKALEVLIAEALKAAPEPAPDVAPPPKAVVTLAHRIARALKAAKRPLVVSGTGAGSEAVLQGAANVARALHKKGKEAGIFLVVPECNSLGLGLMAERHLEDALETVEHGGADACLVLENDLYRRMETPKVDRLLNGTKHVILLDHTWSPTAERADAVLPAAAFAESDGTLVNNEGRSQRFFQVYPPEGEIAPGWRWLGELLASYAPGAAKGWETLDGVTAALAEGMPVFGPVVQAAPGETFRAHGQKIPRQSHRFSGRTAMLANVTMHEPPPPLDPDSPLAFSMEGYEGMPPSALIPRYWAPGWNSAQAVNKFQQEIDGPLVGGDPGIRLLEPAGEPASEYFRTLPAPFGPRDDAWLLVTSHHIFGSEELSVRAPGILQRIPPPLLALNPSDAKRIGVIEGGEVELTASDTSFRLRVSLHPALPPGVAGVPAGVPGLDGLIPRGWGKMKKAGHD